MKGYYTVLELWNGDWWRWVMRDGKPIAFIKEDIEENIVKDQDVLSVLKGNISQIIGSLTEENFAFTVTDIWDRTWDVYHLTDNGEPGTLVFREEPGNGVIIGMYEKGHIDSSTCLGKLNVVE